MGEAGDRVWVPEDVVIAGAADVGDGEENAGSPRSAGALASGTARSAGALATGAAIVGGTQVSP
jgi:hypothetical protein